MTGPGHEVSHDFGTGLTRIAAGGPLTFDTAAGLRKVVLKCIADLPIAVLINVDEMVIEDELAVTIFAALSQRREAVPVLICAQPDSHVGRVLAARRFRQVSWFPDEDAAMTALRQGEVLGRSVHERLNPVLSAPEQARAIVTEFCDRWQLKHLSGKAEMIVSELVTNSVVHAGTEIELVLAENAVFLHIRVRDRSRELPRTEIRDPLLPESGRGTSIVDALASAWGANLSPWGKTVWATLRVKPLSVKASAPHLAPSR